MTVDRGTEQDSDGTDRSILEVEFEAVMFTNQRRTRDNRATNR